MVRQYSLALNRLVERVPAPERSDERRQDIAICIMVAVTMVEVFVNAYFQALIQHEPFAIHRAWIMRDLQDRRSLSRKLLDWPRAVFGRTIDEADPKVRQFRDVLRLRNDLVPFRREEGRMRLGDQAVRMIDTAAFDCLTVDDAVRAANSAYAAIHWVLGCVSSDQAQVEVAMADWTSTGPSELGSGLV